MAFKTATKAKGKPSPVTNRSKTAVKRPASKAKASVRTVASAAKKTGKATAKVKR